MRTEFDARGEAAETRSRLFFIVGSGRCGTTLLRALLAQHPDVCIPGETHFFTTYKRLNLLRYRGMGPNAYSRALNELHRWRHIQREDVPLERVANVGRSLPPSWESLFLAYLTAYRLAHGKPYVGDKTPGYVRLLPQIHRRFPQAKVVHLIRDPRAVAASYLDHTLYRETYGNNVVHAALKWREAASAHLRAAQQLGNSYRLWHYERLVDDPARVLRDVCEFLGHDYTDRMLSAYRSAKVSAVDLGNHRRIGSPIDTRRAEAWRERLSTDQKEIVERIAGELMLALGYERSESRRPMGAVRVLAGYGARSAAFTRFTLKRIHRELRPR